MIPVLYRFQRFMMGRYGVDGLNVFLLLFGVVLSLCARLFTRLFYIPADILYVYVLFRTFSRNIPARQREYQAFLKVWTPVAGWFGTQNLRLRERKVYKYFKCPNCKQQLRAPRGRGKIEVTCQRCGKVFRTKT